MNQTYRDFKFIIVEDGSTDKSRGILESYTDKRICLYYNIENKGVAYTRNMGLRLCNTELIAFMDADDIAPLNRLEREVTFLDRHKDVIGVGGIAQNVNEDGCTDDEYELECLYRALKSMCEQAERLQLGNYVMIEVVCRKQYGKQVAKAFWLWN